MTGQKKAALIGTGSGEMTAPFNDSAYDIIALNWNVDKYPRTTISFEIHDTRTPIEHEGVKCFTQSNFPHDKVKALNAPFFSDGTYYKSSLDYMLAYCIVEEYDEIALFGFDLAIDNQEYFHQKPSACSWIGLAIGKGIKVTVCDSSPLMKSTYVYGRETRTKCQAPFTAQDFKECKTEHEDKVKEIEAENRELKAKIDANLRLVDAHQGVIQTFERLIKTARAIDAGDKIDKLTATARVV